MTLIFKVLNDRIFMRWYTMYSDIALQLAIKFNELPAETQIVIMQTILIIAEILQKNNIIPEWIVINPGVL